MSRRRRIFQTLAPVIALGALCVYAFGWPSDGYKVEGQPVAWLSNQEVLLLADTRVTVHNIAIEGSEELVFAMPDEIRNTSRFTTTGCFSDSRLHVGILSKVKNGGIAYDGLKYEIDVIRGILLTRRRYGDGLNPFDCMPISIPQSVDVSEASSLLQELIGGARGYRGTSISSIRSDLFHSKHARDVRTESAGKYSIVSYRHRGSDKRLTLKFNSGKRGRRLNASWSGEGSRYLLYQDVRDAAAKLEEWPFTAWIVDLEAGTSTRAELPKPAWVKRYGEALACFSCGCGCYRRFNLHLVDDRIYAHLHGIGYPSDIRGLYVFDLRGGDRQWRSVVKGDIAWPLAFSPDGCRLAYTDRNLKIANLCQVSDP